MDKKTSTQRMIGATLCAMSLMGALTLPAVAFAAPNSAQDHTASNQDIQIEVIDDTHFDCEDQLDPSADIKEAEQDRLPTQEEIEQDVLTMSALTDQEKAELKSLYMKEYSEEGIDAQGFERIEELEQKAYANSANATDVVGSTGTCENGMCAS
ncbi:hypothetical protein [Atopobium fossor]|uniref:hypothetical protein n=1 Tax=Atopobium fossor TaxID=39487 RepID=UPI00041405E9|nr:hypothetical protein [Atopobium fossor]